MNEKLHLLHETTPSRWEGLAVLYTETNTEARKMKKNKIKFQKQIFMKRR